MEMEVALKLLKLLQKATVSRS